MTTEQILPFSSIQANIGWKELPEILLRIKQEKLQKPSVAEFIRYYSQPHNKNEETRKNLIRLCSLVCVTPNDLLEMLFDAENWRGVHKDVDEYIYEKLEAMKHMPLDFWLRAYFGNSHRARRIALERIKELTAGQKKFSYWVEFYIREFKSDKHKYFSNPDKLHDYAVDQMIATGKSFHDFHRYCEVRGLTIKGLEEMYGNAKR